MPSIDEDEEDVECLQYKVILLGDGSAGKTCIATRFAQGTFNQQYKQTIGLDFFIKRIHLPGNKEVAIQLWDIGGQSIGSKMVSKYIHGAHAVMLVYDITNYDSFQNLDDWYRLVRRTFRDSDKMPYITLVGNKCDLSHVRAVRMDLAHRFADENGMCSYFMSAKSGDQVHACFNHVAATLSGVKLSRADIDEARNVVTAQIVKHQQHDPNVNKGKVPDYLGRGKKAGGCLIQ
ncbi:unnamed protein product [Chrysoparadoxa australica]